MERIKKPFASRFMLAIRLHCYKHYQPEKIENEKNRNICHSVRSHCCRLNGSSICAIQGKTGIQNHINKQTELIIIIIVIIKDEENNNGRTSKPQETNRNETKRRNLNRMNIFM